MIEFKDIKTGNFFEAYSSTRNIFYYVKEKREDSVVVQYFNISPWKGLETNKEVLFSDDFWEKIERGMYLGKKDLFFELIFKEYK